MKFNSTSVMFSCGLGVIGVFGNGFCSNLDGLKHDQETGRSQYNLSGTGYYVASFVEGDPICDQAYKELKEKFPIVFQSEVRKNYNSGNMFYFIIFDVGQ